MTKTKAYDISKWAVYTAYERVKANKGSYGVDGQSIEEFEKDLKGNLYKIWNRMSSGSYFPQPVRAVTIPKTNGGTRVLGIPTVEDRIAQMVAKLYFEPCVELLFLDDSYGYRPNKSAIQAIGMTRKRCWARDWVLEYDIKGLFDNIRHDYLLEMVRRHTTLKWVILYVERWLTTPFQQEDGSLVVRTSGTPQGGVISPVLSNLFLHYAFDSFMTKEYPKAWWERYADDGVLHCKTYEQAVYMRSVLRERFRLFGLELNEDKTRIVYCKDVDRIADYPDTSFDFLGYTFRPRLARNKFGKIFLNFLPAISDKAVKGIKPEVKRWRLQLKVTKSLNDLAGMFNSQIQGWISYYGHYYKSELVYTLRYVNQCLVKWVRRKYKKYKHRRRAEYWLGRIAKRDTNLFAHWRYGVLPTSG